MRILKLDTVYNFRPFEVIILYKNTAFLPFIKHQVKKYIHIAIHVTRKDMLV